MINLESYNLYTTLNDDVMMKDEMTMKMINDDEQINMTCATRSFISKSSTDQTKQTVNHSKIS